MENLPVVSVILPTYNRAEYLQRSIDSVLRQTYPNWELIIWDDGSTDSTQDFIELFKDQRIKYFYSDNRGVSHARNMAMAASSGEYVAFLDSDDEWLDKKLSVQVGILNTFPQVELLFSDYLNKDVAAGTEQCAFDQYADALNNLDVEKIVSDLFIINRGIPENLVISNFILPTSIILRRNIFERSGYFSEELRNWEDPELWWRMGLEGVHFAYVNKVYVIRYRYPGSLSTAEIATYANKLKGLDLCLKQALAKGRTDLLPYLNDSYRDAWQNLMPLFGESRGGKRLLEAFIKSLKYGFQWYSFRVLLESVIKVVKTNRIENKLHKAKA